MNINKYQPSFEKGAFEWPNYIDSKDHPFGFLPNTNGGSIKWHKGDSVELYEKNAKKFGNRWKYYKKDITYNLNKSGYRTKEWADIDWKNSAVLLGCSITYGVGLDDDETLAYYLEQKLDMPVINLGVPSAGNEKILQNLVCIINNFEMPKMIIINYTANDRITFYGSHEEHYYGPWDVSVQPIYNKKSEVTYTEAYPININNFYKTNFTSPIHTAVKLYHLNQTVQALCKDRTKLVTCSIFSDVTYFTNSTVDTVGKETFQDSTDVDYINETFARDIMHPSSTVMEKISNIIVKGI